MAPDAEGLQFSLDFFKGRTGYLVDIGAHDGVEAGSMTRAFMERGWMGLLIEPLPVAYAKLHAAYKDDLHAVTLNIACSDKDGTAMLYPCGGVSTLGKDWADVCQNWWDHVNYADPIEVETQRLGSLLPLFAPKKIDYLQIDTEGHDYKILIGMDWSFNPDLICIETLDMCNPERKNKQGVWQPSEEINTLLNEQGYELSLATIGGNGMYVRKDLL